MARETEPTPIEEVFDLDIELGEDLEAPEPLGNAALLLKHLMTLRQEAWNLEPYIEGRGWRRAGYIRGAGPFYVTLLDILSVLYPEHAEELRELAQLEDQEDRLRLPELEELRRALEFIGSEEGLPEVYSFHRLVVQEILRRDAENPNVLLDVDSGVEVGSGGSAAARGARREERKAFRALVAVDGERGLVLDVQLRPREAGVDPLETFLHLQAWLDSLGIAIRQLRADRAFAVEDLLLRLEVEGLSYTIDTAMSPCIREDIEDVDWVEVSRDGDEEQVELASAYFELEGWSRPRRLVLARRRERGKQLTLWPADWRYEAFVTNLQGSPEEAWRAHRDRPPVSERFEKLDRGYGIAGLALERLGARAADPLLKAMSQNVVRAVGLARQGRGSW